MHRKKVDVQIGPFWKKREDGYRAPIRIMIGTIKAGQKFDDDSPKSIKNAIKRSLLLFVITVFLFLIYSRLK